MKKRSQFKRGAASFYIVAISTLILVIIGASFAGVIISEVTRTSNDDLAQSAYDSALAGIEDGKLAYYTYQKCKDGGASTAGDLTCSDYVNWIEADVKPNNTYDDCDIVANALGRDVETDSNGKLGVLVREGQTETNASGDEVNSDDMKQYYTCVKIKSLTQDVLGMVNEANQEHAVRIRFHKDSEHADPINQVGWVRLSWHSIEEGANGDGDRGFSWMQGSVANGIFGTESVKPAVLSLTMIQTAPSFDMNSFNMTDGSNGTNRGTLYFVPQKSDTVTNAMNVQQISAANGFSKSNNKDIKNEPFLVNCNTSQNDYACSVEAEIPNPYGSTLRSEDTFVFSVALPYGGPQTHYTLEFLDKSHQPMTLDGVQISIDSTGRANDLFRRVETRMEPADAAYPYPIQGIDALDEGNNQAIWKNFYTACEYSISDKTC